MPEENIKTAPSPFRPAHWATSAWWPTPFRHASSPRFKAGEPIRTRSITFRLRDNFSGIGSYTATLDGEWILLERNPMQGTITHTFDDSRTPKGRSYTLQLTVTDNCGNKTV